jgi:hypothetical protein
MKTETVLVISALLLALSALLFLNPSEASPKNLGPPSDSLSDITSGGFELNYVAQPSHIVSRKGQVIDELNKERVAFSDRTRVLPDSKTAAKLYWS